MNNNTIQQIIQALEQTILTKTIEPDLYAEAVEAFIDEYGAALHQLLGEQFINNDALAENSLSENSAHAHSQPTVQTPKSRAVI